VERDFAATVKAFAHEELGFDLVGIAGAAPLPGATRLVDWLAAGSHGEMAWMAETAAVRRDPTRFLPGVQSVICVAMSYHDAKEPVELAPSRGRVVIARYARRKDYHDVIRPRLARLGRFLERQRPGSRWRTAVDSAPVLERELAARAGLGWIGKNTCLIHRRLGSEILLGELFTTVALAADRPHRAHCGTCTACLRACPTGALESPGALDARRCISYLTIEHRTEIPTALTSAIGSHLAGCDICQAVCPWNRRAEICCAPALRPRPHLDNPSLGDLCRLNDQGFLTFAAGTPLRRFRFSQFQRNLEVLRRNLTAAAGIS
jgi:epoxyqueuosine reductase